MLVEEISQIYLSEKLLHFIWQFQLYNHKALTTVCGQSVQIDKIGTLNSNAGPDFLESTIKIGDIIWSGQVEIHIKSSDWFRHKHQNDAAYNTVILHVVYENDLEESVQDNLPIIELKKFVSDDLFIKYEQFIRSKDWIPCGQQANRFPIFNRSLFLEKLYIERLENKCKIINNRLEQLNGNWEQLCFESIAKAFGSPVNSMAFSFLSERIDVNLIAKNSNNKNIVEALFFGQSGFLPKEISSEEYVKTLQNEYQFLKHKHGLQPLNRVVWKQMRMRPSSLPTMRIAQLSALFFKHKGQFFSQLLTKNNIKEFYDLFKIELSEYWKTHYVFDKESKYKRGTLTKSFIDKLVLNSIIPLLFSYTKYQKNESNIDELLELAMSLKSEQNSITKNWESIGIESQNAMDSQALIQLKKEYCTPKRCLSCQIGHFLLKE